MSVNLELQKQLKLAAKTGSYIVGRREVPNAIKGTKLLVWSASANIPQSILDECRKHSVPTIKFGGNPVELGRACGIPFRVSVIAVKTSGDADLTGFTASSDYQSGTAVTKSESAMEETKAPEKPKVKKDSKKKDESEKASAKKSPMTGVPDTKKKDSGKAKSTKKSAEETGEKKPKKAAKKKSPKDEE